MKSVVSALCLWEEHGQGKAYKRDVGDRVGEIQRTRFHFSLPRFSTKIRFKAIEERRKERTGKEQKAKEQMEKRKDGEKEWKEGKNGKNGKNEREEERKEWEEEWKE
jgi:chromatin remodeling complex protein RSC6